MVQEHTEKELSMQSHAFETAYVPASLIYGASAPLILDELGRRYQAEVGLRPRHWVIRLYENGAAIPVPTQITPAVLPDVRVRQLFKQTLDKITQHEMRDLDEADTFNINNTSRQLQELGLMQAA